MFAFPAAATVYCALLGALFLGLWLYYDGRDRASVERERRRTAFHCIRCGRLYTARAGAELGKCPGCGHQNMRLRF